MALKDDRYTYRVTWSEEDNEHVGLCAEFPSLSWLAKDPDTALKGIRKLVQEAVSDLEKEHESLPEPIVPQTLQRQIHGARSSASSQETGD
jgi:predicted RNase H-like HicB family nuclease